MLQIVNFRFFFKQLESLSIILLPTLVSIRLLTSYDKTFNLNCLQKWTRQLCWCSTPGVEEELALTNPKLLPRKCMWFDFPHPTDLYSLPPRSNICSVLERFIFINMWRGVACLILDNALSLSAGLWTERTGISDQTFRLLKLTQQCSARSLPLSEIRRIFY